MIKPAPPCEPAPEDCCGTGCIPCVWDCYEEAMDDYKKAVIAWEAAQAAPGTQPDALSSGAGAQVPAQSAVPPQATPSPPAQLPRD